MVSEKKYAELNSRALGSAFAVFGLLGWIVGLVWHGGMGQPTMVGMMYSGFSFLNPTHALTVLVLFVAGGYVSGEIIARAYNWFLARK